MLSSLMASVEGAEQPLAESVSDGVREAARGAVAALTEPSGGGDDSWQCAELKWSSSADESGAVKSQRRQRQHAWTRLQRRGRGKGEWGRGVGSQFRLFQTHTAKMSQIQTQSDKSESFHGFVGIFFYQVRFDQNSGH